MPKIETGKLLSKQYKKSEFQKYDAIAKYLFIKKFYKQNKPKDFQFEIYKRMATARGRKGKLKQFIKLINSFEMYGYKKEYPFIVKSNFYLLGGSHRLACCLYFNIKKVPYIFYNGSNKKKNLFSKEWLINNNLNDIIPLLQKTKDALFEKFNV